MNIDEIRGELRDAIFWSSFQSSGYMYESDPQKAAIMNHTASMFVEFGKRSGLFNEEEANDWLDGIQSRRPLADILFKYERDPSDNKYDPLLSDYKMLVDAILRGDLTIGNGAVKYKRSKIEHEIKCEFDGLLPIINQNLREILSYFEFVSPIYDYK